MLKLKIVLSESDVRRVTLKDPVSFQQLLDTVKALFEETVFHIQYVDEENELIRIASQDDLDEAMLIVQEQNWKCLRIVLKHENDSVLRSVEPAVSVFEEQKEDIVVDDIAVEDVAEEAIENKVSLMPFNEALGYLLNLYSEVEGEQFDGAVRVIVDMMQNGDSYDEIVATCKLATPELIEKIDWNRLKLAGMSLAAVVHLIEDGDLHNVRLLVPILVKYGFPLQKPFRFNDFKVTLAQMLNLNGLPDEVVLIRDALMTFVCKINIPEDAEEAPAEVVHQSYRCDGCAVKPIIGNRYHCHQCKDYDLCESCENAHIHDRSHDMIKIRRAIVEPPRMPEPLHPDIPLSVSYDFIDETPKDEVAELVIEEKDAEVAEVAEVVEVKEVESASRPEFQLRLKRGLHSKFVSHVGLENGDIVSPNSILIKTWKVLNNGSKNWPLGTRLVFLNGDRRLCTEKMFEAAVAASGEAVEISAMLNTPARNGCYRATFRLSTPQGRFFGNKFWVEVNVFNE